MAHFIGYVQGDRGPASRRGSKKNGLEVKAKGWHGAIFVAVWHNETTGHDYFRVWHKTDRGESCVAEGCLDIPTPREDERITVLRALLPPNEEPVA